ncbi:hypothetical protein SAMN05445060_4211 [Williamsia sterculiae]|uniref:Uncharacterized protein n=1 Tax=Williamsia sterculiae TaxID=1344003 RepID=A0A1N7HGP3_9NOCA|nr:hypothetical protein SAMN05445060_4211 [Williamsia sterculiae]
MKGVLGDDKTVAWMDSTIEDRGIGEDELPPFVSSAILLAWEIAGLGRRSAETAKLMMALTEQTPGWSRRWVDDCEVAAGIHSVFVEGNVWSPYGPLISNSHNVVYERGGDDFTAIQLSVTALPHWGEHADDVRLVKRS